MSRAGRIQDDSLGDDPAAETRADVLFLTNNFPESSGDEYFATMSILLREQISFLESRGIRPSVFSLFTTGTATPWVTKKWRFLDATDVREAVFWKRLDARVSAKVLGMIAAVYCHSFYRKLGRPATVHVHNSCYAGIAAYYMKRFFGCRYILTEHFSWFHKGQVPKKYRKIVREVLLAADQVMAVSPALVEDIREFVGDEEFPCEYVPNVVDESKFSVTESRNRKEGSFRLIHVSTLRAKKNIDRLVQSVGMVVRSGRAVELQIVGEGPESARLRQLVDELGLAEHITFLGYRDNKSVATLLSESDALVVSSEYETFAIPLVEAMACGKPVISTACGGPEHFVTEDNGILVPVGDIARYADAICQMVDNYERYDPNAIRLSVVARFGLENVMGNLIETHYRRCR